MTGKRTKHVMLKKPCRFVYGDKVHTLGDPFNVDPDTYEKHKDRLELVEDLDDEQTPVPGD